MFSLDIRARSRRRPPRQTGAMRIRDRCPVPQGTPNSKRSVYQLGLKRVRRVQKEGLINWRNHP